MSLSACVMVWFRVSRIYIMYSCHFIYHKKKKEKKINLFLAQSENSPVSCDAQLLKSKMFKINKRDTWPNSHTRRCDLHAIYCLRFSLVMCFTHDKSNLGTGEIDYFEQLKTHHTSNCREKDYFEQLGLKKRGQLIEDLDSIKIRGAYKIMLLI